VVALHPGLVLYTPALMSEGPTAALVTVAAWACAWTRDAPAPRKAWWRTAVLGVLLGVATLVRPQSLLLAPLLGLLARAPATPLRGRLAAGAAVLGVALATCAPWTARNCLRMDRCALVSVNGGWNLLIGAGEKATGAWSPVDVPPPCREVWGEADKDACFGREALRTIAASPARWLGLVPAKLGATFDYAGAGGYYLHASSPGDFGERAKVVSGALETLVERIAYLGALLGAAALPGPRRRGRAVLAAVGALLLFGQHAWPSVLLLGAAWGLLGSGVLALPVLHGSCAAALAATAATHAVFFGAGRYGLVVFPLVTAAGVLGFSGVKAFLTALLARSDTRRPLEESTDAPD
jgi:hypothetical protein